MSCCGQNSRTRQDSNSHPCFPKKLVHYTSSAASSKAASTKFSVTVRSHPWYRNEPTAYNSIESVTLNGLPETMLSHTFKPRAAVIEVMCSFKDFLLWWKLLRMGGGGGEARIRTPCFPGRMLALIPPACINLVCEALNPSVSLTFPLFLIVGLELNGLESLVQLSKSLLQLWNKSRILRLRPHTGKLHLLSRSPTICFWASANLLMALSRDAFKLKFSWNSPS